MASGITPDPALRIIVPPIPQEEDSDSIDFSTPSQSARSSPLRAPSSLPSVQIRYAPTLPSTSSTVYTLQPTSTHSAPPSAPFPQPSAPPIQRSHSDSEIVPRTSQEKAHSAYMTSISTSSPLA